MQRKVILILLLLSSAFAGNAQPAKEYDRLTKKFTDSLFSWMHKNHEPVLLAELIDTSAFYYIRGILSADTFSKRITYDGGKTVTTETFILTGGERKLIDSFYCSPENFRWTTGLIDATILTSDTVRSIYSRREDTGNYLGVRYGDRRLFTLSKPVFLRNNSICILYKASDCGMLCGGGTLVIYKKENDKWKNYMVLADWVK